MSDYVSETDAVKAYTEIQRAPEDADVHKRGAGGGWFRRLAERVLNLFRRHEQVSESSDGKSAPRSLSLILNCIRRKASAKVAPSNEIYRSEHEVSSSDTLPCSSKSSDTLQDSESSVSIPDLKEDGNKDDQIFSQPITITDDDTRTAVQELKSFQSPEADDRLPEADDAFDTCDREGAMSRQSQYSDEQQLYDSSSGDDNSREDNKTEEERDLEELISCVPQTSVLLDLKSIRETARLTFDKTNQALRRWATVSEKPFPSTPQFTKAQVINLVSRRAECRTGKYLREMNSLLTRFNHITEAIEKTEESQQRMAEMRCLPGKNGVKRFRFAPRADTPPTMKPRKSERLLAEQYVDSYKSGDNTMIHKRVKSESLVHRMVAIEEEGTLE